MKFALSIGFALSLFFVVHAPAQASPAGDANEKYWQDIEKLCTRYTTATHSPCNRANGADAILKEVYRVCLNDQACRQEAVSICEEQYAGSNSACTVLKDDLRGVLGVLWKIGRNLPTKKVAEKPRQKPKTGMEVCGIAVTEVTPPVRGSSLADVKHDFKVLDGITNLVECDVGGKHYLIVPLYRQKPLYSGGKNTAMVFPGRSKRQAENTETVKPESYDNFASAGNEAAVESEEGNAVL